MKDENFNDNQMQDEYKRREIIQKIRESAGKETIPEDLDPENLDNLIKQEGKAEDRSGRWREAAADFAFRYRKAAGVAAAFVILVIAAVNLTPLMYSGSASEKSAGNAASMDSAAEAAKEDAQAGNASDSGGNAGDEKKDSKDMAKADEAKAEKKDQVEGYVSGSSYEELYEQI